MRHAALRQRALRRRGQEARERRCGGRLLLLLVIFIVHDAVGVGGGWGRVGEPEEGGRGLVQRVGEDVFPVLYDWLFVVVEWMDGWDGWMIRRVCVMPLFLKEKRQQ